MKDDFVDEFFLVKYIILPQLIFSVSVTDVKCRPVLHLCVVFFSGPQGSCNFVVGWGGGVRGVTSFIILDEQL